MIALHRSITGSLCLVNASCVWLSRHEAGNRGTEMCLRRVPEFDDERMLLERVLDDAALHAFPASVNQAHFAQTRLMRGVDVLLDDRRNITRRERVEIDRVFDGDLQVFDCR